MSQAIAPLVAYLEEKGYLRQKRLVLDAVAAGNRIVNTTGDGGADGTSVSFAGVRRASLLVEEVGTTEAPYTRAEGSVEVITIASPAEPSMWPITPSTPGGVIPGTAPLYYATLTPAEVAALPGADQFIPALHGALIAKAIIALTPPEEPAPEEPPA